MITLYTLTYNEELLIQFMINHYRERFPNCKIIIYDNSSTDRTVEISKNNNCEIRYYNTGNTLNDGMHMQIKNSCWRDAQTDWVLVCDLDELLDIDQSKLLQEQSIGTTIIKPEAWNVVNMNDHVDLHNMNYGFRYPNHDKCVLFNKKFISDINYGAGCHDCNPKGLVKFNQNKYILYHYKYMSEDLMIEKSKTTASRLSEDNVKNNWGLQCRRSEKELRDAFKYAKSISIKMSK